MNFDISRQPLVPAFLTLTALAVAVMCGAGAPGELVETTREAAQYPLTDGLALSSLGELLDGFQAAHPVWSRIIAGVLLIVSGMYVGRLAVRYNLYATKSCLAIPLYAIFICATALGGHLLHTVTASTVLVLAIVYYSRSFCNGYGFDGIFRGSFFLGLLMLTCTAAWPLVVLMPLAIFIFRRTGRESIVALAGLFLPLLGACYLNWGAGGHFFAPLVAQGTTLLHGSWFALFRTTEPMNWIAPGCFVLLTLFAALFFLADYYAVGNKPRHILLFAIYVFVLTIFLTVVPTASTGIFALTAVPAALLLPVFFVRIHHALALAIYAAMLAAAAILLFLQ